MKLSTTREATSSAATRELPSILWNPNVHYHFHKSSPPVPILRQTIQSTPPQPISKRSIVILSIHLRFHLPSGLFPSGFNSNNLYAFRFSLIRATFSVLLTGGTSQNNKIFRNNRSQSGDSNVWPCGKETVEPTVTQRPLGILLRPCGIFRGISGCWKRNAVQNTRRSMVWYSGACDTDIVFVFEIG
jgi:hypothetical protein